MLKPRQRELAQAEEPVGMSGPFDIHILGQAKVRLDILANQFVNYDAVVDALDGDSFEKELPTLLFDLSNAGNPDSQLLLSDQEIRQGLLLERLDFKQDNLFGCVSVQDRFTEQIPVLDFVQALEETC
jgi:hypothetical protein